MTKQDKELLVYLLENEIDKMIENKAEKKAIDKVRSLLDRIVRKGGEKK